MNDPVMEPSRIHRRQWSWLLIAAIYGVSLMLPAVYKHGFGAPTSGLSGSILPGYAMVGSLPMAMLAFAWWANPLWLIGLILLARDGLKGPIIFGLAATLLALLVLVFGAFPPDPFELSHFHVGYYVWLASMAALPLAAFVLALNRSVSNAPDKDNAKVER
jgi:hypothetical protein